jgi:RHH-type transcriptional regulator, rel operon repressor / antitoxin RelB
MVEIRLSPEMDARLDAMAKRTGRTKTYLALQAIHGQIDNLENLYLAKPRPADILSGNSKTILLDDVIRGVGLED